MGVMFQHTAARRRLDTIRPDSGGRLKFQHTAARRRLGAQRRQKTHRRPVSTHSRPKAAGFDMLRLIAPLIVSTHSRPKAAGPAIKKHRLHRRGFNTQPPEGGWTLRGRFVGRVGGFNTQPPEGGWRPRNLRRTHQSRFNTQPPEGGWMRERRVEWELDWFQHTAARRRLAKAFLINAAWLWFQHTAARRRLVAWISRLLVTGYGFNTQPPEGGWPCRHAIAM